ncbi:hypothetical protein ARMGADRAFT_1089120 [Armillaria gallica]|uniref:Uncharacterized protein n=1 Tax=Armillaria gallica TaxID=47427 RepID=A0A2H3CWW5_ARMGA|nr:hypothetical protein ARMGADRAFT_1089120 [Armillaria gallica]
MEAKSLMGWLGCWWVGTAILIPIPILTHTRDLEKPAIPVLYTNPATDNHSNLINRLKHVTATIFEDIVPAGHFCQGFDRSTDPLCQRLMGYKSDKNEYTRLPPCLFSDGFTSGAAMFRTFIGVKILTCLLWGKSALDALNMSTKRTNSDLWHMKEMNTSVLAFIGVTTCWVLSGDTKFTSPGNKTGIDYIADFNHYVARIDELVRKGTWSITNTFQFYNDHVFASSKTLQSVIPTKVPVSASKEEEAIWKSLEAIDNEPDSDSEISGIAGAPIISSDEATMSPLNESLVADHHPITNDVSPGPTGVDIDTSNIPLDLRKASHSKKR